MIIIKNEPVMQKKSRVKMLDYFRGIALMTSAMMNLLSERSISMSISNQIHNSNNINISINNKSKVMKIITDLSIDLEIFGGV
jgi:uncharacterized membrane protein YeiB